MKLRMIIMRHGEAAAMRLQLNEQDQARRLTPDGQAQSVAIARKLDAAGWLPTLGLVSDSQRTRETASFYQSGTKARPSWRYSHRLYLSGLPALVEELAEVDGGSSPTVIAIGHNPGFSEAATLLTGDAVSLGTADAVLMSVDAASWRDALRLEGGWKLDAQLSPF